MANNLNLNAAVAQSTSSVFLAGGAFYMLDMIMPSAKVISSPSELPMVAIEIIAQLTLNQVGMKVLGDFMESYVQRNNFGSAATMITAALVQPNLIAKMLNFFQGLKLLTNPSMLKIKAGGVTQASGTTFGNADYATTPGVTTPMLNNLQNGVNE